MFVSARRRPSPKRLPSFRPQVENLENRALLTTLAPVDFGASMTPPAVALNGVLYFGAKEGVHGTELWRSDGTSAGTFLLKDINPGTANASPTGLKVVGNTL